MWLQMNQQNAVSAIYGSIEAVSNFDSGGECDDCGHRWRLSFCVPERVIKQSARFKCRHSRD